MALSCVQVRKAKAKATLPTLINETVIFEYTSLLLAFHSFLSSFFPSFVPSFHHSCPPVSDCSQTRRLEGYCACYIA